MDIAEMARSPTKAITELLEASTQGCLLFQETKGKPVIVDAPFLERLSGLAFLQLARTGKFRISTADRGIPIEILDWPEEYQKCERKGFGKLALGERLCAIQENEKLSTAELAQRVGLTPRIVGYLLARYAVHARLKLVPHHMGTIKEAEVIVLGTSDLIIEQLLPRVPQDKLAHFLSLVRNPVYWTWVGWGPGIRGKELEKLENYWHGRKLTFAEARKLVDWAESLHWRTSLYKGLLELMKEPPPRRSPPLEIKRPIVEKQCETETKPVVVHTIDCFPTQYLQEAEARLRSGISFDPAIGFVYLGKFCTYSGTDLGICQEVYEYCKGRLGKTGWKDFRKTVIKLWPTEEALDMTPLEAKVDLTLDYLEEVLVNAGVSVACTRSVIEEPDPPRTIPTERPKELTRSEALLLERKREDLLARVSELGRQH